MVLGDFNAHLGALGGGKGKGDPNLQGVMVNEVMARYHLNVVSLGSLAKGPSRTNVGGDQHFYDSVAR